MARYHLLFIPGLGDRTWLYRLALPLWRLLGYEPHVFRFGWSGRADDLGQKQAALVRYVDALPPGPLHVIGASAGGTAAVNLLAARPTIHSVITIASPLKPKRTPNELLTASIAEADQFLATAPDNAKNKVTSVYGWYDERVPVSKSRRPGIRGLQLPAIGHGLTIFVAVTVFAGALQTYQER